MLNKTGLTTGGLGTGIRTLSKTTATGGKTTRKNPSSLTCDSVCWSHCLCAAGRTKSINALTFAGRCGRFDGNLFINKCNRRTEDFCCVNYFRRSARGTRKHLHAKWRSHLQRCECGLPHQDIRPRKQFAGWLCWDKS